MTRSTVQDLQARNNVRVLGLGPTTIVFAHGFGCDQTMWNRLAPEFAAGYRTVLFDLVGSGTSDLSAYDKVKYGSLQGYADDLLEIIEGYTEGPVIFVGHSVSATIGMLAANVAPHRFHSLLMVSPSPCYINHDGYHGGFALADIEDLLATLESNYLGWSSAMAPVIMGAPDQPELGQELTNSFCRTDPEIAQHFARVTFMSDHREDLAKVTTPTLILQCTDDVIAPKTVGEFMHKSIAGSTLVLIDNVGHCPHLSSPHASVVAMKEFLEKHSD